MPTLPRKDLSGQRFGRLVVLSVSDLTSDGRYSWLCQCDCGTVKVIPRVGGKAGSSSCGCLQKESVVKRNTTHGMFHRSERNIWQQIKDRCRNPNNSNYPHYGGRGISIDEELASSFKSFLNAVGPRPSLQHSIDRIDVNGNYTRGNLRWATDTEQARNTRRNRLITIDGETKCMSEWAEIYRIDPRRVNYRVNKLGWDPIKALTLPLNAKLKTHGRWVINGCVTTVTELAMLAGVSKSTMSARLKAGMTAAQALSTPLVRHRKPVI